MVSRTKSNPKLYRELSEPFASAADANTALDAFFQGVEELRKQHRFANVYVIVCASMQGDTADDEQEWQASCHYGDGLRAEAMTAWAYGREQGRREAAIGSAVRSAARAK